MGFDLLKELTLCSVWLTFPCCSESLVQPSLAALLLKHWERDVEAARSCVRERRSRKSEPPWLSRRKGRILVTVSFKDGEETLLWTWGGFVAVLVGLCSQLSLICCHAAFLASPKLWGVAKKSPHKRCSSLLSAHCRESDYLLVLSKFVNSNDQISRRRVQSHPSQNFVLFWFQNTAFSSEQFPWGQIQTAHYKQKDARAQ